MDDSTPKPSCPTALNRSAPPRQPSARQAASRRFNGGSLGAPEAGQRHPAGGGSQKPHPRDRIHGDARPTSLARRRPTSRSSPIPCRDEARAQLTYQCRPSRQSSLAPSRLSRRLDRAAVGCRGSLRKALVFRDGAIGSPATGRRLDRLAWPEALGGARSTCSATCCCCAGATTGWSTKRAGSW